MRIAAVGDVHVGADSAGRLRPHLEPLAEEADLLLLAGDLTRVGRPEEAAVLVEELRGADVPVVAVLGNHDYHAGQEPVVRGMLEDAGVRVLEDVLVTQLLSLTEHHLKYQGLIETARAVREQVDWEAVRRRTEHSPFARAFFTMTEGLGVVPLAPADARR